jgi:hypothetical protein
VSDFHKVASQLLAPWFEIPLLRCSPKPTPKTDKLAEPVAARLLGRTKLAPARPNDEISLSVPAKTPTVKKFRRLRLIPELLPQVKALSDLQKLCSQLVRPTLDLIVSLRPPNATPKKVKLVDPVDDPTLLRKLELIDGSVYDMKRDKLPLSMDPLDIIR